MTNHSRHSCPPIFVKGIHKMSKNQIGWKDILSLVTYMLKNILVYLLYYIFMFFSLIYDLYIFILEIYVSIFITKFHLAVPSLKNVNKLILRCDICDMKLCVIICVDLVFVLLRFGYLRHMRNFHGKIWFRMLNSSFGSKQYKEVLWKFLYKI